MGSESYTGVKTRNERTTSAWGVCMWFGKGVVVRGREGGGGGEPLGRQEFRRGRPASFTSVTCACACTCHVHVHVHVIICACACACHHVHVHVHVIMFMCMSCHHVHVTELN